MNDDAPDLGTRLFWLALYVALAILAAVMHAAAVP